ncbi:hypothetical protein Air01nite_10080 [Asanoa iriomotensis]|uniref:Anti-sigma regulatory factor (Ser/Thr protein kinase) n=1 Tax=Asanoa iriomotensis TaxID=234613 RepID=A0ABQ4BWJ8_9ACTN|nr:hypothetical protein Air01nite_10080 [Asanoa iriomotensis]
MDGDVPRLGAVCYESALEVGLSGDRALRFAVAIVQALNQAIQRGGPARVLSVLHDNGGQLIAEISDGCDGIELARPTASREPMINGGLSLTRQLVDEMTVRPGQFGITLRLVMTVGARDRET